ncbi:MAG TPA: lipid II flippase MurJ [Candidatus Polarisedimenticolaceae bacterium]
MTVTARLLRGFATVGALAAGVKVVSLAKELLVASSFGRAGELDAFLLALVLPTTVAGIVGGAFHQATVPLYARWRSEGGGPRAEAAMGAAFGLGLSAAAGAAFLLAVAGGPLIGTFAAGFDAGKLAVTASMALALAPLALLAAWSSMAAAPLHAVERYGAVSLVPVFTPLATIAALSAFGPSGGWPLVAGAVSGAALEGAVLAAVLRSQGLPWRPSLRGFSDPELRSVVAQAAPAMGGMLLHTATGIVDQVMASRLEAGSVAALGYASRLVSAPLGLATLALGTASFAVLSSLRAAEGAERFGRVVRRLVARVALLTTAGAAVLAAAAPWIVRALYERGRFQSADTELVASLVRILAFMVPPFVVGVLGVKVLAAAGRNRSIVPIAAVNLAASVGLNLTLVHFLGIRGIAVANVAVYSLSCAQIWWAVFRGLREDR